MYFIYFRYFSWLKFREGILLDWVLEEDIQMKYIKRFNIFKQSFSNLFLKRF